MTLSRGAVKAWIKDDFSYQTVLVWNIQIVGLPPYDSEAERSLIYRQHNAFHIAGTLFCLLVHLFSLALILQSGEQKYKETKQPVQDNGAKLK